MFIKQSSRLQPAAGDFLQEGVDLLPVGLPPHTGHIVMGSARNQQPIFGFRGRLEERPAQAEWDGPVLVAVNGQQGAADAPILSRESKRSFIKRPTGRKGYLDLPTSSAEEKPD